MGKVKNSRCSVIFRCQKDLLPNVSNISMFLPAHFDSLSITASEHGTPQTLVAILLATRLVALVELDTGYCLASFASCFGPNRIDSEGFSPPQTSFSKTLKDREQMKIGNSPWILSRCDIEVGALA